YRGVRVDVVLAHSSPALQFVLQNRRDLFPNAPIVFSAVGVPDDYARDVTAQMTGISSGRGYQETLDMALRIHPSATRVFVIAESPRSMLRDMVRAELRQFESRVQVV